MNGDRTPALPAELLSRIVACLVPAVDPNASTLPHPSGADLDYAPALPSSPNSDLLAAASSCKLLQDIAGRALYRTPLLRTLKALNLLAETIAADVKKQNPSISSDDDGESSRAARIRSIHLPPGDGLLQPGDTLAEQTCYVDSLRMLFDHATRLDFVSLDHRQAGAALLEFLRPSTACRPRRITLSNLSFSAPPFSTTQSLAPLSKVTHLHLIKIVPPPALISFLVGEQINADEQGNVPDSIKAGLSPRETLECLRLSLLPPDALVEFDAYIAWRQAWKVYEKLSAQQQAQEPAPRAPRGPARRFAVQEALYDLATHSSRLPRLRLLLLELSPLGALPSPVEEEREGDRFTASARSSRQPLSNDAGTSANGRRPHPSDVRATRPVADIFLNALKTSRRAADRLSQSAAHPLVPNGRRIPTGGGDEAHDTGGLNFNVENGGNTDQSDDAAIPVTAEELRIDERDKYWRFVERGKAALAKLWSSSAAAPTGSGPPEIRVVAAKPNGHDRREGFQDFHCQAQLEPIAAAVKNDGAVHASSSHTSAAAHPTQNEGDGAAEEVGCWADPDVFSLVRSAPFLSFKSIGGSDGGWYWTGELPRETVHPSLHVIPSQIAQP
ncbi:conserved hypothetical protein [Sporisorium reilianum SRZ2]|uniref:Uncharacterized protein n=1 Tax=Sporisorium reilianum (strain SRZ2) TaxID=999809 RepID=E6ZUN1_SPORE|nr:conserved hypothetical protein [Sporisorium reilianum SRZ2]